MESQDTVSELSDYALAAVAEGGASRALLLLLLLVLVVVVVVVVLVAVDDEDNFLSTHCCMASPCLAVIRVKTPAMRERATPRAVTLLVFPLSSVKIRSHSPCKRTVARRHLRQHKGGREKRAKDPAKEEWEHFPRREK